MYKPTTDDAKRSYTMSRIRSKDTSIEVLLRKALWHAGIRYRKNYAKLPGTPDIAITKHQIAIFCDGEFWHGKDWESKKSRIQNNRDYWVNKIDRNIDRDNEVNRRICGNGWTVMRFWGNEIHDNLNGCVEDVQDVIIQRTIDSYNTSGKDCAQYPCSYMLSYNNGTWGELEHKQCGIVNPPCLEDSFEILCINK